MATPTDLLWDRELHTGAKHDILRGYLEAWFPILLNASFESVTYAEGFAGPGEYTGGEPGSPILALEQVLDRPAIVSIGKEVRFVFIEERQDRFEHLREVVRARWPPAQRPAHIKLSGEAGRCEDRLLPRLHQAGAWGNPVFANLDGWGMVPLPIVAGIGKNPASEVLVTFTSGFFVRFAGAEESLTAGADAMFGSGVWRAVQHKPPGEKHRFVVEEYRKVLHSVGFPLTLAFEMVDDQGHQLFIIHGSSHHRGLTKMKDSMWKVDPVYGVRFRDPRDPAQASFAIAEPDLAPLRRILVEHLKDGMRRTVGELRKFALLETIYREPHAVQVLRDMVKKGELAHAPEKGGLTKQSYVWRS